MSAQIAEGASDVGNAGIRIFVMREMSARGMRVQEMEIIILRGRTLHKCLNPIFGRHPWQVLTTQQGNAGRCLDAGRAIVRRSEEHTSELQSLMRISYAVFCLKKKNNHTSHIKFYMYTI